MSTPDKQHLIFHGDDAGNIWKKFGDEPGNGELIFSAGDVGILREYTVGGDVASPNVSYADTLKLSGVRNLRLIVPGAIIGGAEDCVDINHCHDVHLVLGQLHALGNFVGTIKGGSTNITIDYCAITNHGRETDWDLGNWSDQSNAPTGPVTIINRSASRDRVRILTSRTPTLTGPFKVNALWRYLFLPVMTLLKKMRLA